MAIYYEQKSQTQKSYGIEVHVRFWNDAGKEKFKTFLFKDQNQVDLELKARCQKAIDDFSAENEREKIPEEIVSEIETYFEKNENMTKTKMQEIMNEKVIVEAEMESISNG